MPIPILVVLLEVNLPAFMSLVFSLMNAIIVFEMTLTCILHGFYLDLCDINLALTNFFSEKGCQNGGLLCNLVSVKAWRLDKCIYKCHIYNDVTNQNVFFLSSLYVPASTSNQA